MPNTILIIGTLDTKGAEIGYLRDRLQALGLHTIVVDDGILGEPLGITLSKDDITRAQAATYIGTTIDALCNAGSRGKAVAGMRDVLIHHYNAIDIDEVWKTVVTDVPELIAAVEHLLPQE